MFFCVTGYLHPPDRYTAYLKYSPATAGKWGDGERVYRRELPYYHVRTIDDTIIYLEQSHPEYVDDCPVRGIRFSLIPQTHVALYYAPEIRVQAIVAAPQDTLEEEVQALVAEVAEVSDIPIDALGVTGSILIGLHNPNFSDIDLTVYGLENARRVRQALRDGKSARIRRPDAAFVERWAGGIAGRFPLTLDEAKHLSGRRWNYVFFGERYVSIHPTRRDDEILESYGDHVYEGLGAARVRAVVTDAAGALFMPAVYRVEVLDIETEVELTLPIEEIVSYEGLYRDVVDSGAEVEAYGKLERVGNNHLRVVVGTSALEGTGYIRLPRASLTA
jgi:predicted nucleotidyltransferase